MPSAWLDLPLYSFAAILLPIIAGWIVTRRSGPLEGAQAALATTAALILASGLYINAAQQHVRAQRLAAINTMHAVAAAAEAQVVRHQRSGAFTDSAEQITADRPEFPTLKNISGAVVTAQPARATVRLTAHRPPLHAYASDTTPTFTVTVRRDGTMHGSCSGLPDRSRFGIPAPTCADLQRILTGAQRNIRPRAPLKLTAKQLMKINEDNGTPIDVTDLPPGLRKQLGDQPQHPDARHTPTVSPNATRGDIPTHADRSARQTSARPRSSHGR